MQFTNFIGIDVSKETLDIAVVAEGRLLLYQRINNKLKDIKTALPAIMKQCNAVFGATIFCMEHTGIYNLPLIRWLQSQQGLLWMESGTQIRRSLGAVRGKSDKVDSQRIAMYAFTHQHQVKIWKQPRAVLQKIAALIA